MKKSIYIITFLLLFLEVTGQNKALDIPLYNHKDTSLLYKYHQQDCEKMGLDNLLQSTDTLHFRLWTYAQAVDIWTSDYRTFHGTLSNYVRTYDVVNEENHDAKPKLFFSKSYQIDTAKARYIYNLFMKDSIFQIPSSDSIPEWSQARMNSKIDTNVVFLEYSTGNYYSFKEFDAPSYFVNIEEATTIDSFVKQTGRILKMDKSFELFFSTLPADCYGIENAIYRCKK